MTADLRRLAEQATTPNSEPWITESELAFYLRDAVSPEQCRYIAAANPQAILALLDERDHANEVIATLAEWQAVAERRVAALEEQIDAIREAWEQRHVKPEWMDGVDRALLAAAPETAKEPGSTDE